ncbi:unnamed protein product (macronuclear) [Paramecium tetraurelia]|uniref:Protein kinase domain-containing protein n=1 Tax=Paramecium tetraurelia TaxID=5888 RepID=A0BY63_PARTE|nr:uncharacterized protein GSPATT00033333001 [Paramecium tetraurelia]CAK63480.1 unnamed protein product [Paramecium tetraurelia]|eukprot:XP_001430878.1 hypothetical protein (macronuclear) [Paramecium tetraurelia strain d4-2]
MLTILHFNCQISSVQHIFTLYDESIEIKGPQFLMEIDINYKMKIRWDITDKRILSLQIKDLLIQANQDDLLQLKQQLDGRVIYLGIQNIYETMELVSAKENSKVCQLEDRLTKTCVCCKALRKDAYDIEQLHQSIRILYKLQQYSYFPRIYEIYESKTHLYIVQELMFQHLSVDLMHEEIQIIIYELLKIVKILIENKIYYQKIKLSNLMLDKKGNLRLVGFCPAQQINEIDVENYLDNVGNIMMNLYGVNDNFNSLPKIADNGNEFIVGLMNPNRDYRFSFEDAMQHEYIQNIFCEPNLIIKKSPNPKLITDVAESSSSYTKKSTSYQKQY